MVEDVEEIAQRGVARADALIDEFAVGPGEHSQGAVQAHEIHAHQRRLAGARFQRLDLAGGKRDIGIGAEAHHFGGRGVEAADYLALGLSARHQAHRLEELEQVGFPLEQFGDGPARYSRIF